MDRDICGAEENRDQFLDTHHPAAPENIGSNKNRPLRRVID